MLKRCELLGLHSRYRSSELHLIQPPVSPSQLYRREPVFWGVARRVEGNGREEGGSWEVPDSGLHRVGDGCHRNVARKSEMWEKGMKAKVLVRGVEKKHIHARTHANTHTHTQRETYGMACQNEESTRDGS